MLLDVDLWTFGFAQGCAPPRVQQFIIMFLALNTKTGSGGIPHLERNKHAHVLSAASVC